ncbi:hypothetical protein [Lysobacter gummosus]|uniref:hypothetical protein n=1 Tax=Lysobacter gummosus TaxID=262324 RepID=UPI003631174E
MPFREELRWSGVSHSRPCHYPGRQHAANEMRFHSSPRAWRLPSVTRFNSASTDSTFFGSAPFFSVREMRTSVLSPATS